MLHCTYKKGQSDEPNAMLITTALSKVNDWWSKIVTQHSTKSMTKKTTTAELRNYGTILFHQMTQYAAHNHYNVKLIEAAMRAGLLSWATSNHCLKTCYRTASSHLNAAPTPVHLNFRKEPRQCWEKTKPTWADVVHATSVDSSFTKQMPGQFWSVTV